MVDVITQYFKHKDSGEIEQNNNKLSFGVFAVVLWPSLAAEYFVW